MSRQTDTHLKRTRPLNDFMPLLLHHSTSLFILIQYLQLREHINPSWIIFLFVVRVYPCTLKND